MDRNESSRLVRPLHPMPVAVIRALKDRGLDGAYRGRPAYQQNDYIGWITSAKRPETQRRRLEQMLDELEAGDVYMKMAWRGRE
ncbi:MAG: YdeI/OmpD-associated family protein [Dehalococcoidia bacterium]